MSSIVLPLKLLVHGALSDWCMGPEATSAFSGNQGTNTCELHSLAPECEAVLIRRQLPYLSVALLITAVLRL